MGSPLSSNSLPLVSGAIDIEAAAITSVSNADETKKIRMRRAKRFRDPFVLFSDLSLSILWAPVKYFYIMPLENFDFQGRLNRTTQREGVVA